MPSDPATSSSRTSSSKSSLQLRHPKVSHVEPGSREPYQEKRARTRTQAPLPHCRGRWPKRSRASKHGRHLSRGSQPQPTHTFCLPKSPARSTAPFKTSFLRVIRKWWIRQRMTLGYPFRYERGVESNRDRQRRPQLPTQLLAMRKIQRPVAWTSKPGRSVLLDAGKLLARGCDRSSY